MVPGDHGDAVAGRMRPRRAEEVVPVEQRGLARRPDAGRQGDHAAHRPSRSFVVDLSDGQDPLAVRRGAQSAVPMQLSRRRRCAQGHRCGTTRGRPGPRSVTEPHPLVRLVHIGEGTGGPSWHEAQGPPAVLVDPAADAHALRRMVGRAQGIGPHDHRPSSLGRAGLEPVDGIAVRAELRQRDLGPSHVTRRERRGPTPITCQRGHGANVPVATARTRRRRHRPLQ